MFKKEIVISITFFFLFSEIHKYYIYLFQRLSVSIHQIKSIDIISL